YGGSCQALTTPATNNPNQTAIKNSSSNGANVLTATLGACTLMSRLGKPDYGSAAQTYNDGLNGLLQELGPVAGQGQVKIFLPTCSSRTASTWAYLRSSSGRRFRTNVAPNLPTPSAGITAGTASNLAWTMPIPMI